jgi:hypothetical protein
VPSRPGSQSLNKSVLARLFAPSCAQNEAKTKGDCQCGERTLVNLLFERGTQVLARITQRIAPARARIGHHVVESGAYPANTILDFIERLTAGRTHQTGDLLGEHTEVFAQRLCVASLTPRRPLVFAAMIASSATPISK